jgi:ATP-dependent phosphoenolpyruvate carboxykinase
LYRNLDHSCYLVNAVTPDGMQKQDLIHTERIQIHLTSIRIERMTDTILTTSRSDRFQMFGDSSPHTIGGIQEAILESEGRPGKQEYTQWHEKERFSQRNSVPLNVYSPFELYTQGKENQN